MEPQPEGLSEHKASDKALCASMQDPPGFGGVPCSTPWVISSALLPLGFASLWHEFLFYKEMDMRLNVQVPCAKLRKNSKLQVSDNTS